MFCTSCGKSIPDDAHFCPHCAVATGGTATPARPALARPRDGRMIAGVCAGLARHFGWSLTMLRLVWVLLVIFGGTGVLLYIILWIVVPSE